MSALRRFLFGVARRIAGKERREWVEAMEAETASIDGDSTGWAIGCVWAAAKDRLAREWRFILAILMFPVGAYLFSFALFIPTAWLFTHGWIPGWVSVGSALLSPLPFAYLIGRMRPGMRAHIAVSISFLIGLFTPLTVFWVMFDKSPFSWFGEDSTWYMMGPLAGLTCAFLVWQAGAWLGSRSHRAKP